MTSGTVSPRRAALLGVLLLLAATASGCGVGLPTQPDVMSNPNETRAAASLQAEPPGDGMEMGDPTLTLGQPGSGTPVLEPEVIVPTPGSSGNGLKLGHAKRWRNKK